MRSHPQDQTIYDVLTFGETMLRFTPPARTRIEQTHDFQVHVGGSESNTAVGLARLGIRTAWLSRLPGSPLGRMVSGELARYGVDVQHVVWCDDARVGLYFLEEAGPPRGSSVIYDRRHSAISRMTPDDLPRQLFAPGSFRAFHTTGITLAISDTAQATAELAVELAKAAGALISFDVNYRAKLWSPEQAAAGCDRLLQQADLVFIPDRDAQTLFDLPAVDQPESALEQLSARYPQAVFVMTRGRVGSMAIADGNIVEQGIFASDEVGRLGGGDAFSAGFLARCLESQGDITSAMRWGAATSALKYSIPGDLPLMTRSEVERLVASDGSQNSLRR
ncbi:MAG TPA: sugar kinase [Candidatus Deferrimicrobium sp.]|nr:sugar kinase [Candidatus Deferrimicrobium sp.]